MRGQCKSSGVIQVCKNSFSSLIPFSNPVPPSSTFSSSGKYIDGNFVCHRPEKAMKLVVVIRFYILISNLIQYFIYMCVCIYVCMYICIPSIPPWDWCRNENKYNMVHSVFCF